MVGARRAGQAHQKPIAKSSKAGGISAKKPGSPLEAHLALSMAAAGIPTPEREYRFHPTRKWRLDFAWPALLWAVEVEGGIYRGGGHTHVKDLKRDIEKHRALTLLGWRCLRFHGDEIRSGLATEVIAQALTTAPRAGSDGDEG